MTPKQITHYFDRFVQGQTAAKKALSVIGFLHHTAYQESLLLDNMERVHDAAKMNILLLGPSGVGKTYLVKKLSEFLDLPFYQISAANLSNEGYVGSSLNDHLVSYFTGDAKREGTERMNHGIIFIDELDKLCPQAEASGLNAWLRQMQTSLLRACEGFNVYSGKTRGGNEDGTHTIANTKDLLFIFAGNFPEIRESRKRDIKPSMGFVDTSDAEKEPDLVKEVIAAGLISELVGRLGFIVELEPLSSADLKEILCSKEKSVLKQYENLFKFLDLQLHVSEEDINGIIDRIQESDIGARALKKELLSTLLDSIYEIEEPQRGDEWQVN